MTQTPTDALRLVPNMPTVELTDDMLFKIETGETVTWGELKRRQYEQAVRKFNTMREDGSLAAPASPLPGGGWQDISTAPKDGTPLLAGSIHHSDREVVCWQDGLPSGSMDTDAEWEGWVNDGPQKDRFYANPRYFTHWQPLPAAPTGDA